VEGGTLTLAAENSPRNRNGGGWGEKKKGIHTYPEKMGPESVVDPIKSLIPNQGGRGGSSSKRRKRVNKRGRARNPS